MRKQTKLVAVLSAAALLAIGASMTSFAATGWAEEDGTWVYYSKDGSQVTDSWQKSGNNWFYLNSDGEMSTETLIDDGSNYFYVDASGVMVTNQWVAIENENSSDEDEPEAYWYYFQSNGKAYKSTEKASFKTINGKSYAFDSEAKMLYGWVKGDDASRATGDAAWQEGNYYCGDENDGARTTGWMKVSVIDDNEDKDYYFYFNPANGKKTVAEAGKEFNIKGINGKKYAFDADGVMQKEWAPTSSVASASDDEIANYQYFNGADEGWRLQKGWVKVVPQEKVNSEAYNNDDTKWFYADGSGNVYNTAIKTINSKKYAFNAAGEMLSGLWALKVQSDGKILEATEIDSAAKLDVVNVLDADQYAVYYFGTGDDGSAKTGNQTVDIDGDSYSYSFGTTGMSKYKGVNDTKKTLLVMGRKIKAEKDYRYQAFTSTGVNVAREVAEETDCYLVNTSGTIMKNKNDVKDADGWHYKTDAAGKVIKSWADNN